MTLKDILAIRYCGNWAADRDKFAMVDAFISDPSTSIEDACAASDDSNLRGMGERVTTTAAHIAIMRS